MRISLRLPSSYDGLIYIFDGEHHPPAMRSHSHQEIEVALVLEGSLICRMGDHRQKLAPGCMSWIYSGLEHQVLDRSQTCKMIVAVFKPDLIRRYGFQPAGWDQLREKKVLVKTVRSEDVKFFSSVTHRILDGYVDHEALNAGLGYGQGSRAHYQHVNPGLLNSGLHFLLAAFWQAFAHGREFAGVASVHPAVIRAIKALQEGGDSVSLPELAKRCGISFSQLSRLFHGQTGLRLNEYRNSLRLERFLSLYRDGSKISVTEACFEAGFGSYAQFAKVFARSFRRSPREYIRGSRLSEPIT